MPCYTSGTMENSSARSRMANSATRVIAIIGFIALLGIGMYGSVRVAQAVPGAFSRVAAAIVSLTSIFVPANETITLSVPSLTVLSNTPVTLAIEHANKKVDGTYTFRYSCIDGVSISAVNSVGTADALVCNTPYPFTPFNNSITVTPVSATNRFVDVEVFVSFVPTNTATATIIGSTVLTVENRDIATSPTTVPTTNPTPAPKPKPRPTTNPGTGSSTTILVPQGHASDPNGYVDLTARVIEVGTLNDQGVFVASSTPVRGSKIAVRFAIENSGTKTSKEFTFSSVLPTMPPYTYFSNSQVALGPQDRIEYTIGFDSFQTSSDAGDFIVNVDPTNTNNERNKDNNIIHYTVYVTK